MRAPRNGGWPYATPPNGPFVLNRASQQARGLVAWYPALNQEGNLIRDRVRHIDGPFTNAPAWRNYDTVGQALYTDGVDDRVLLGSSTVTFVPVLQTHVFSWSIWACALESGGEYMAISSSDGSEASDYYSLAIQAGTAIIFYFRDNGGQNIQWGGAAITQGTWYHIVGVSASTTSRALYIDGILRGTSAVASSPDTLDLDRASIGARRTNNTWNHGNAGAMTDLRVYDRPLGAAEVWSMYLNRWELYAPAVTPLRASTGSAAAAGSSNQVIRIGGGGIRIA